MSTYYDTLGVEKTATPEQIKTAYRQLAKKWHPDKNQSPEAKEHFQQINEAYQTLSDPVKRQNYDTPPAHQNHRTVDDMMNAVFGDIFGNRANRQTQTFTVHQITLTLEQAYSGGEGAINGTKIKYPAGIRTGNMFQVAGKMFTVRILPHEHYSPVNTNDLSRHIEINTLDAIVGMSVTMKNIDGSKISFDIPEGVQNEQVIRLMGKGMPIPETNNFGNLFIVVVLKTPTDLTYDLKASILNIYPKQSKEY